MSARNHAPGVPGTLEGSQGLTGREALIERVARALLYVDLIDCAALDLLDAEGRLCEPREVDRPRRWWRR